MLLLFFVQISVPQEIDKQNYVICVTLTTDQSDLKGLPWYETVEFSLICLVNRLERLLSTPGEIIPTSKQLYLQ